VTGWSMKELDALHWDELIEEVKIAKEMEEFG
jgi:hypothetical protein